MVGWVKGVNIEDMAQKFKYLKPKTQNICRNIAFYILPL